MVTMLSSRQEMFLKKQRGLIVKWNKVELWFLCTALSVIARNILSSLESFESMVTKLHSGLIQDNDGCVGVVAYFSRAI